jgi:hypothetical protein
MKLSEYLKSWRAVSVVIDLLKDLQKQKQGVKQ